MKISLMTLLLVLSACTDDDYDERFEPRHGHVEGKEIVLRSGVQPTLGDTRCGIGDVRNRDFLDADGHTVNDRSITLSYRAPDRSEHQLTVGLGSVFQMGGAVWRVVKVKPSPHGGAVVVRVGP